jgi:hypothetical protein
VARADRVLAVSHTTARTVVDRLGVDPSRVDVVPPVVVPPPGLQRRPADEPTFLFVGVPEPHKQPELAVAALAAYRVRHGSGRLRFLGPLFNGHRELLTAAAEHHGVAAAVSVEGRVPAMELEAAMAGATALLAVSRIEGFGLPPVEAALRGVAVVANDTPIARETLGDAAVFVAPDAAALAEGMAAAVSPSAESRAALAERYSPRQSPGRCPPPTTGCWPESGSSGGVGRQVCLGAGVPGELRSPLAGRLAQRGPAVGVVQQGGEVGSQRVDVGLGVGDGVAAHLGRASRWWQHGRAARHRLQHGQARSPRRGSG